METKAYYKLVRREDIIPSLRSNSLENNEWHAQLQGILKPYSFNVTKVNANKTITLDLSHLPKIFAVKQVSYDVQSLLRHFVEKEKLPAEEYQYLLVCKLNSMSADDRSKILYSLGILPSLPDDNIEVDSILKNFYIKQENSIFCISPEYILKNFPLTYSEKLIYESVFVKHPLVGFEKMLVPLEDYYKFLSEQSFNEFLTILVRLGVKKVELIYSENKLMRNALDAYANYEGVFRKLADIKGSYEETSASSNHSYWGMEFEGKQIAPQEIPKNFLDEFPFHRNNGTLKAMIEGIRFGNRNKTYTVERSFTGTYGLDVNAAVKILSLQAGFNFNRETYHDEKSTFNVLY